MTLIGCLIVCVIGFFRSCRYSGCSAVVICCFNAASTEMTLSNSSRASLLARRTACIWFHVMFAVNVGGPGSTGLLKGVREINWYFIGDKTIPRWPC